MPIIQILNWPSQVARIDDPWLDHSTLVRGLHTDNVFKRQMSDALRKAFVEANIPGINALREVLVSFDTGHTPSAKPTNDNKTLAIWVIGLYDQPDQDRDVRDRLAIGLLAASQNLVPDDWEIEVLITRFYPEKDTLISG